MADSLASMKSYPDTKFYVYWYYGYWVLWVQGKGEEEGHEQNVKIILSHNFANNGIYGTCLLQSLVLTCVEL